MSDLWPQKLLENLPYPRPTTGWLADPQNAPAWLDDVHRAHFSATQVAGCVLWLDSRESDGIVLANASITDGSALNTGWTHTNVTPTLNQDGVGGTLFTVSSTTTPRATQNIATCATHTTAQAPCTITVKYKAGTAPFLLVESVAAAANRTWVNLSTHAIGTSGANHSGVSISAPDSLGYRTVSVTMVANALGTAPTARFTLVNADNVTTGASVGQTIWLKEATVDQPRASALVEHVSGLSLPQATVNLQLGYEATGLNGHPCIRGYGSQYNLLPVPALIAAASGDDKPLTVVAVLDKTTAEDVVIGLAAAAGSGNTNYWDLIRLDSFRLSKGDGSANTALATGTAMANGPHVVAITYSGTTASAKTDGVTTINNAALNVGSTTLDSAGLFCRPRSSPVEIGAGRLGAVAVYSRVLTDAELAHVQAGMAKRFDLSLAA